MSMSRTVTTGAAWAVRRKEYDREKEPELERELLDRARDARDRTLVRTGGTS